MTNFSKNTSTLGARVIRIKSTKTIFPGTNMYMADNKAINAIKAHASCDHERALLKKPSKGTVPDVCKKRKRRTCCTVHRSAVTYRRRHSYEAGSNSGADSEWGLR